MLTDPKEREKLDCVGHCTQNRTIDPICVAFKCGKDVVSCIEDQTCRDSVKCIPEALKECSEDGFACLFGKSKVCRQNLECLGHGIEGCTEPAVNVLTDAHIADFIDCAGNKCPHPGNSAAKEALAVVTAGEVAAAPHSTASQLVCIAEKCGVEVLKVLEDQDTKDLLDCASRANTTHLCSSVWDCLADDKCKEAVTCWSKPLEVCRDGVWHLLTDPVDRKRLVSNVQCLEGCGREHNGEVVDGAFCVMDKCSKDLLDCRKDSKCWDAVQCLPRTAKACTMPTLDAYVHQQLFSNSVKCLGRTLESCGRGAVEMLRNEAVAKAVRCSAQCTRPSSSNADVLV